MLLKKNVLPLQPIMETKTVTLINGLFVPTEEREKLNGGKKTDATSLRQGSTDGVSPSCARWYLMRVAYGQEQKASDYLSGKEGVEEVFLPQWMRERVIGGKPRKVYVSLIPNMLLVKSTQEVLRQYVGMPPTEYLHFYYQPYKDEQGQEVESGRRPMVIPDRQMASFMKWYEADAEDKIYMQDATFRFKKDDIVRVTSGDFEGFTGHVVRLKGQTRVGVNIEGVGFICTTYIPRHFLEKTDNRNQ